jgi:hypothetical protein
MANFLKYFLLVAPIFGAPYAAFPHQVQLTFSQQYSFDYDKVESVSCYVNGVDACSFDRISYFSPNTKSYSFSTTSDKFSMKLVVYTTSATSYSHVEEVTIAYYSPLNTYPTAISSGSYTLTYQISWAPDGPSISVAGAKYAYLPNETISFTVDKKYDRYSDPDIMMRIEFYTIEGYGTVTHNHYPGSRITTVDYNAGFLRSDNFPKTTGQLKLSVSAKIYNRVSGRYVESNYVTITVNPIVVEPNQSSYCPDDSILFSTNYDFQETPDFCYEYLYRVGSGSWLPFTNGSKASHIVGSDNTVEATAQFKARVRRTGQAYLHETAITTASIKPAPPKVHQPLIQHAYPGESDGYVALRFGDNVQVSDKVKVRWATLSGGKDSVQHAPTTNSMYGGAWTNLPTLSLTEKPFAAGSTYTWWVSFLNQTCEATVSGEVKFLPPIRLEKVSSSDVACYGCATGSYSFRVGTTEDWGGKIAVSYGTPSSTVQDTINLVQRLSKTYTINNLIKGNYSVKARYVPIIPQ